MPPGKERPYATDVRVPLYVRGPGVPMGGVRHHPTNQLDVTATIAELAGAARFAPRPLDGLSFAAALTDAPPPHTAWRNFSFSEFHRGKDTWRALRMIGADGAPLWALHLWCTNETEVFDERADPHQNQNLGADSPFGRDVVRGFAAAAVALGGCEGEACSRLSAEAPAPASWAAAVRGCSDIWRGDDAEGTGSRLVLDSFYPEREAR